MLYSALVNMLPVFWVVEQERGELGKLELVGGRARKVRKVEEVCAHRRCHLLHMRGGTSLVKGGDGGEAIGMVRVRAEKLVLGAATREQTRMRALWLPRGLVAKRAVQKRALFSRCPGPSLHCINTRYRTVVRPLPCI